MQAEETEPIPNEVKPKKRKTGKILLWLLGILFLIITIPVALVFIYEKEIKAQIVNELNKHLKVKVFINPDDIDFTVIKTFPKAAVWFKNVTIMGSLPEMPN